MRAVLHLTCQRNVFIASIQYANIHGVLQYICVYTSICVYILRLVYTLMYLCTQLLLFHLTLVYTVVVVPPYSACIEEHRLDVALEDYWYARPQLFPQCYLRPKHGRLPRNSTYISGPGIYNYIHVYRSMYVFKNFLPDDLLRELVFFNTFESL